MNEYGYFNREKIKESRTEEVSVYSFIYLNSIIKYIIEDKRKIDNVLDLSKEAIKIGSIDIDYEIIDILSQLRCFYSEESLKEFLNLFDNNVNPVQLILFKIDFLFDEFIEKNDDKSMCVFKYILNKHLGKNNSNYGFLDILLNNEKLYKSDNKIVCIMINIFIDTIIPILYNYESMFEVENEKYKAELDIKSKIITILNSDGVNIKNSVYQDRFHIYNFIKNFIKSKKSEINEKETDNTAKEICEVFFTNYESYHSIFEDEIYCVDDLSYCVCIMKKLLHGLQDKDSIIKYAEILFSNDLSMLNKLALFLIVDKQYILESIEFGKFINTNKFEYILRTNVFEYEIKKVFECLKNINPNIEKRLDDIINKGPYIFYGLYERENHLGIWKQKRYKALKQFHFFGKKYEYLRSETKVDYDLIAPVGTVQVGTVEQLSPINFNDMKIMSVNILVDSLNKLDIKQCKTNETFKSYTCRGIGETLKKVFTDNPLKYLNEMNKFNNLNNHVYSVYIIEGIEVLLNQPNNGIEEYYQSIVKFLINIYSAYDFKKVNKDKLNEVCENRFYKTIFSPISFMLNKNFIEGNMIPNIRKFIKELSVKIAMIPVDEILWSNNDFISYIINSVQGAYLNMILAFSLFLKRNNFIEYDNIWDEEKEIIELLVKNNEIDSNIFLGWHFVNFEYLEKVWIESKITELEIGSDRWQYFMGGYCYSNCLSEEQYRLMYKSLKKALTFQFKDKTIKQKISTFISLGFLIGYEENLNKTLYNEFIKNIDYKDICSFTKIAINSKSIDIFKNIEYQKIQIRALEFWEDTIRTINHGYDIDIMEKIAGQTILLLNVLENVINEKIAEILVATMKICGVRCNQYTIIKYLLNVLEKLDFNTGNSSHVIVILSNLKINFWNEELGKIFRLIKDNVDPSELLNFRDMFIYNNQHLGVNVMEIE